MSRTPPALASRETGSITLWLLGLCVTLLFIGGISLDLWRAFSTRRALAGIVDAAAIAGASSVDQDHLRRSGQARLDPVEAEALALARVDGHPEAVLVSGRSATATVDEITVTAAGSVDLTLLRILAPAGGPLDVQVSARSAPRQGPR
ncbi:MAG: Tad domain-containing protein [Actinomycetota bacterium]|nr:Tad domain-containing protein [Actinomycetota bacterium]